MSNDGAEYDRENRNECRCPKCAREAGRRFGCPQLACETCARAGCSATEARCGSVGAGEQTNLLPDGGRAGFGRVVGYRGTVKLCRVEEYTVDVYFPETAQAEDAALDALVGASESDEWDVVESEVLDAREVYSDDPDAHRAADWLEAPTAPSEETFWDDSRHFPGGNSE